MRVAAERALIGGFQVGPTTVGLDETGRITEVRPHRPGDPAPSEGLLIPGLVNAHLHLELSWAAGRVPGGMGFASWVRAMTACLPPPDDARERAAAAARTMASLGTAGVSDICNGPSTAPLFQAAGIGGVVQQEILGLSPDRQAPLHARVGELPVRTEGSPSLVTRASPHALYSMHPPLLEATVEADGLGHPPSIHIAEDLDHERFLRDGSGPFAEALRAQGIDLSSWVPPGMRPLAWLEELGLLDRVVLVHGVLLNREELGLLARRRRPLVLCVRSNLHIGGRLPDVLGMVEAGIPLALGTDSLASCADLDVLREVELLTSLAPSVPLEVWLTAATAGGASAFRLDGLGSIAVGAAPGLLLVHPERPWEARTWLVEPRRMHA